MFILIFAIIVICLLSYISSLFSAVFYCQFASSARYLLYVSALRNGRYGHHDVNVVRVHAMMQLPNSIPAENCRFTTC